MELTEFSPSHAALEIVKDLFQEDAGRLLRLAAGGLHQLNEYHNLRHELGVVYWAYTIAINEPSLTMNKAPSRTELQELVFAGLFHDHNHSGGHKPDNVNVARAVAFIRNSEARQIIEGRGLSVDSILDHIQCTVFVNGVFPVSPETLSQGALRDADLMSIYTEEGQHSLIGLFHEMGIDTDISVSLVDALDKNEAFLESVEMHTAFGEHMRAQHLTKQLARFRTNHSW
jgi:hypothetical protein